MAQQCFIGIGSNLGNREENIRSAITNIGDSADMKWTAQSGLYLSPPWGRIDQPAFINAVAEFDTTLVPQSLLNLLLDIERQMGRIRAGDRWGPRIIDLDLLLVDDLVFESESLALPHRHMHERAFVLVPLIELSPACIIPGRGCAELCLQRIAAAEVNGITPLREADQPC